jgi:hypothetical protein
VLRILDCQSHVNANGQKTICNLIPHRYTVRKRSGYWGSNGSRNTAGLYNLNHKYAIICRFENDSRDRDILVDLGVGQTFMWRNDESASNHA